MDKITIGIIEDDKLLNAALNIALLKEGYSVANAFGFHDGVALLKNNIDLLLLDIGLPDGDGYQVCRYMNAYTPIPTIFLTARDDEEDMLEAFSAGADDYVIKPFPMKVLMKRIEAVLRRSLDIRESYTYMGLKIIFAEKRVFINQMEISLTAKEYHLLEYMILNRGQILTKAMLLDKLWDQEGVFVEENTLSVAINRLRRKIEPDKSKPIYIQNVFGMGYIFGGNKGK